MIMNSILYIAVFLTILGVACQCEDPHTEAPVCISEQIQNFRSSDLICEEGASIIRYSFQDKLVYVFNPGNCGADMMSDVYDEYCNRICGLGGIAGNLMCKEVNFWDEATGETLIWKN